MYSLKIFKTTDTMLHREINMCAPLFKYSCKNSCVTYLVRLNLV